MRFFIHLIFLFNGLLFSAETTSSWNWHQQFLVHKWIYLAEVSGGGLWFYDSSLGWLYTTKEVYPYVFQNTTGHWLYDQSDTGSRKFWNSSTSTTISPE
jgi:hypothetical protein